MKKYLLLIVLLLCPAFIFADMAAPKNPDMSLIVVGKDGVKISKVGDNKSTAVIPYETEILCISLSYYEKDNTISCEVEYNNEVYYGTFSRSEVIPTVDEINEDNIVDVLGKPGYGIDYFDEDVTLVVLKDIDYGYKGPYAFFDKVDVKISKDTQVKCKYIVGGYALVNYNNQNIWINTGSFVAKVREGEIITYKNAILYDSPFGNKTDVVIPSMTTFNFKYESFGDMVKFYYVEFNGQSGWINNTDLVTKVYDKASIDRDIKVSTLDGKKTKDVKKGTIFNDIYKTICDPHYDCQEGSYILNIDGEYYEYIFVYDVLDYENIFIDISNTEEHNEEEKKEEVKPNKKSTSMKEYVLYCVAGAFVVAIIAFVTIKVVNKKKKDNVLVEGNTLPEQPVDEKKED